MLLFLLIGIFTLLSIALFVLAGVAFHDEAIHSHDVVHATPIRGTH